MLYAVKARFIPERLPELYLRLMDGSIQRQKPDGGEICASMTRARITAPGVVEWTEICFCPTPLQHERATVYDSFFRELSTVEIKEPTQFAGESFFSLLRASADSSLDIPLSTMERFLNKPWPPWESGSRTERSDIA